LVLSTKRLVAAAKFFVEATKKLFVVPNFVVVTKPFFPREMDKAITIVNVFNEGFFFDLAAFILFT